ncbi:MAG: hypothetical protein ACTIJ9_15055 [Aequorivita sp.]
MKKLSTIFLLLITLSVCAQKDFAATDSFVVKGEVKNELKFSIDDIEKYQPKEIDNISIINYREESGNTANQMKGVLVKDLLKGQQFKNPKALTELQLTFTSADGHKEVYSWNEIFNTSIGDKIFIITSMDEKKFSDSEERILVITPSDLKTGRTYIKNLSEIDIQRAK